MTTYKNDDGPMTDLLEIDERDTFSGSEEHGFVIKTNGRLYCFTLDLCQNENIANTQRKIAEAINARDIGISASVETDENNDTTLSLSTKHSMIFHSPKPFKPNGKLHNPSLL